ncbi:pyrroline-5-carboxylate reductase [Arcanobacterium wilhelmae]|uniref:Pyrroline-5-carboxylate reductase n=1 Tax=Arcanobacterium wilhelmae TaxID=1803177 RepID=A0ABT9N9G1_9ACTO|nr:pyrroline-5-carboxylate reductase [Arcanobacterium wilhelmae]MDP9800348.1 pyrroline-5-carboxylate reductase [Arcanobacterium wilhelmae]WFN89784.1 pyrroline-5-carboxylate reductase [Arcanobacterium wilhelmae]
MLGFIGLGNMNGAILKGVLAAGIVEPGDVYFTRAHAQAGRDVAGELGINFVESNAELAKKLGDGDVIISGVKPQYMLEVLRELGTDASGKVIVSVAAGVAIERLESALPEGTSVVRAMPNVPAQVGAGMTALAANAHTTEDELHAVEVLFGAVGETVAIAEPYFATFSAIAGCSPAWTLTYIDALSRAALAAGMPKDVALKVASQAVLGSAKYALEMMDEERPAQLLDRVTSPGGTTIAGLVAMEKAGFSSAVVRGVESAIARDAQLG